MRRVHRHRRQQRLHALRIKSLDGFSRLRVQFSRRAHADPTSFRQRGQQFLAPALVLLLHKLVQSPRPAGYHFARRQPVGPGLAAPLLRLLQQPRHAHFHEFVQVARGDAPEISRAQAADSAGRAPLPARAD